MAIPPTYAIHVHDAEGGQFISEVFQGSDAFDRASDFFKQMKNLPEAHEVWFTRSDGDNPVWAGKPIKRDAGGKWLEFDG